MKIWKGFQKWMKVLYKWKWETVDIPKDEWWFIAKSWKEFELWQTVDWYKAK